MRNKLDIYILITVSYHKVGRRKQTVLLNNIIKKQLVERAKVGHRNIYGVEKPVYTHKMLINAITFYVCLQEIR